MAELIRIKAKIKFFKGEKMRQSPVVSKYRPAIYFKGASTRISGSIDLIDQEEIAIGEEAIVYMTFIKGIISESYFEKGTHFTISEMLGYDLGEGDILELIK